MSVSELSDSAQNLLKTVWALQEWSDAPVTPTVVAERLGVRLPTVSGAVSKLTEQGLMDHQRYGEISLTARGRDYAVSMVRRHRLIETFLVQVLGYRWDEVHDEAEQLEHAVSELLVDRVDAHLGYPRRDPHGDPIPAPDGTVEFPAASPLSRAGAGNEVVVERVADADPGLLQHLADHGVVVGATLRVADGPPYSDALQVSVVPGGSEPLGESVTPGQSVTLGRAATDAVWVSTAD